MSTTTLAVILIGAFILLLIYWLVRSRGNTTGHIDTTLTGVGAATEAVEDLIDAVTHKKAETPPASAPLAAPEPAPVPAPAAEPVEVPAPVKAPVKAVAKSAPKPEKAAAKPAAAAEAPAKPAAEKAPKAAAAKAPAKAPAKASAEPDNLRQIKGVGPKLATLLTELGVTRFDQIAAWKPADIEKIDDQLGTFKGRPARDNWVEQAGFLAKGDIEGFEAKFGKLEG